MLEGLFGQYVLLKTLFNVKQQAIADEQKSRR